MKVNTVADLKRALTPGTPIVMVEHSLAERLPKVAEMINRSGVVASVKSYGIEIDRSYASGRTSRLEWPRKNEFIGGDGEFTVWTPSARIRYVFGESARTLKDET